MTVVPSNKVFSFTAQMDVVWEQEVMLPVDNLRVGVMCCFRAEWGVADQALERDRAQRPPVALVAVTFL